MSKVGMIDLPKSQDSWNVDTLWWIVTGRCNLRCKHCYIEAPSSKYDELSYGSCVRVIEQAKEAGIQHVFITGGEPFIRRDILELIEAVFENDMDVKGIETNGTLLSNDIMDSLESRNITYYVSYDGVGFNESFRGIRGRERKIIGNMNIIKEQSYGALVVNSILNGENKGNILKTYDLVRELDADGWRIFTPANIGYQKSRKDDISYDDEGRVYLEILKRWVDDDKPFDLNLGSILTLNRELGLIHACPDYACDYFRSTVTLLPDGSLVPCCRFIASAETMKGMKNVFNRPIKDQIHCSRLKDFKNVKLEDLKSHLANEGCGNCGIGGICELGCRMNGYLATGNFFSHEPKHCLLMKNYYRKCLHTLGLEIGAKEVFDE